MSVSLSACLSNGIVQFWLKTSISQHLVIWLSWNLTHLSTIGCISWCWWWNSCQQLSLAVNSCFFSTWSPKINVRGLLCKSLFSKMFWKLSVDEFWVLKLFCSSKTDRVTDFFLFQLSKHLSCVFSCSEVLCVSLLVLWCHLTPFLAAVRCCQLIFSC